MSKLFKVRSVRFAKEMATIRAESSRVKVKPMLPDEMTARGLTLPELWNVCLRASPEVKALPFEQRHQLEWMDYATGDELYELMRRRVQHMPWLTAEQRADLLAECEWMRGEPADLTFTPTAEQRKHLDPIMAAYLRGA